jgi:hypothetical protein
MASEAGNDPGVTEQTVQMTPTWSQSAAMARFMAHMGNGEWGRLGGMSGLVGFVHGFSVGRGG